MDGETTDRETTELERCVRHAAEGLEGPDLGEPVDSSWLARRLDEWGSHHGLFSAGHEAEAVARIRVAELAARAFEPAGRTAAEFGGQLVLWLFLFDDAFGEGDPRRDAKEHFAALEPFRDIAQGVGMAAGCAFQKSLEDWMTRARSLATPAWSFRFGQDLCGYLNGCLEELPLRRWARPVPVFRYRALRALTVGTRPVFAVIELGTGLLDPCDALRPDFVEIRRRAALLTAWVNDLYSFPKEHAARDPLNLVAAIAHRDRLDPHDAIGRVIEVYNVELEEFESLARRVSSTASLELALYVGALRHWVHANRWWTENCGRYSVASRRCGVAV